MRLSLIAGTLITGVSVYIILSYFLIPERITLPMSVLMSLISLGLTRYHFASYQKNLNDSSHRSKDINTRSEQFKQEQNLSTIVFVFLYITCIVICSVFSQPDLKHVYTDWYSVGILGLITLSSGIVLSFFLPGYAVLLIITKGYEVNTILKILVAYLFSMLITGLIIYLSEIFIDNDISGNKTLLIGVNVIILGLFVIVYRNKITVVTNLDRHRISYQIVSNLYIKLLKILKTNQSEFLVFGSLFVLLIVSTNYLYGGITIGDQWYHQNRIIYFMSGQFKEYLIMNGDDIYPLLQSSLLAGTTILSGIPLVNTYASIAFLNMTAVFSFYYFCSAWFPNNSKRAALLASSLFLLASGFGWLYIISLTETSPITSEISSISKFLDDKIRFTSLIRPTNFMIAAHPDFSTALIYISLPAGFTLLGLIRSDVSNKLRYTVLLSLIAILGVLSHDEFYIFILLSSMLPLIFNMQKKYSVYFALLFALGFTYAIDTLLPVRHYTTNEVLGLPLILLSTVFVLLMLSLYILRQNLKKRSHLISLTSIKSARRLVDYIRGNSLIPKGILVAVIFYLYVLGFIVWDQLPANLVGMHTQNYSTPWYVYPLRLGIVGLIGLVSVLSYVFKKYETEVFVFGILSIVALFEGPYYNEHRFNKYLMAGMIGFASFFIFKLLLIIGNKKPILNGIVISSLIIFASVSSLLYVGYNALVMQAGDNTYALGRRNFPSEQELNMFDMMRSKILTDSGNFNIASFPVEYNFQEGGIMTKLHAFSGMPILKIPQTQYLLNATTLESFFYLLEKSNTKYIIIPTSSINQLSVADSARFSVDNFQHIYDDNNYVILSVPALKGPSSSTESQVGIVYRKDIAIPTTPDKKELLFSNNSFDVDENDTKLIYLQKDNKSESATLSGYKKDGGKTIWSKNLRTQGINYIESTFMILGENKTGDDTAGVKWREGKDTYIVSLSNRGLELKKQLSNNSKTSLLAQNTEVKKNDWVWYSLKIVNLHNSTNIYLDDLLKIKVPRVSPDKPVADSRVALYSVKNIVEFQPIEVAKINYTLDLLDRKTKYHNSYPISSLALSGSTYNTFAEDDYSVLSKNIIMLPFDPEYWNDTTFNNYLNYVKAGGTLVVSNSDDNMVGRFAKLLSIQVKGNSTDKFDDIVKKDEQNAFLNVTGYTRDVEVKPSFDTNVTAYYRNHENKSLVPFAIERDFANSGRIIYINSQGYFEAVYNNPKKYFDSLSHFSDVFDSKSNNKAKSLVGQNLSEPIKRFIGNVEMSGKISVNGSSVSIPNISDSQNVEAKAAYIIDKHGGVENYFENLSLKNIELTGRYEVSIDSIGELSMPGSLSHRDYVQMSLPNGFNMTLRPLDDKNAHVKIFTDNNNLTGGIEINSESKVVLNRVASKSPLNIVPVIVKNPLIVAEGNTKFDKSNFYGDMRYIPLTVSGRVEAKIDFIDDLTETQSSGTKTQFLSYLGALAIDGKIINQDNQLFKMPGSISSYSKKMGLDVPLNSILISPINIALVIAVSMGTTVLIWSIKRMKLYRQEW